MCPSFMIKSNCTYWSTMEDALRGLWWGGYRILDTRKTCKGERYSENLSDPYKELNELINVVTEAL